MVSALPGARQAMGAPFECNHHLYPHVTLIRKERKLVGRRTEEKRDLSSDTQGASPTDLNNPFLFSWNPQRTIERNIANMVFATYLILDSMIIIMALILECNYSSNLVIYGNVWRSIYLLKSSKIGFTMLFIRCVIGNLYNQCYWCYLISLVTRLSTYDLFKGWDKWTRWNVSL